jgi:serine/threonine protein kinase
MSTLSPGWWQEVSPYLDQALSLPEEQREGWLESLRSNKPEIAESLRQLLEEHRALSDEQFLESLPAWVPSDLSRCGQQIGVYRLVSFIGQGGMGSVWMAERNDDRFDRRVALKFLPLGMTAGVGAERFRREGKILGQLTHPHIAELMDAGVSPNGEPYLVLEYVEGQRIDQYCDKNKLDVDARIRLFLDVLSAVGHAHTNLIVHRDIKPSNVLVRNDGEIKLLDFGIAKFLAEEPNSAATLLTGDGRAAMTPQYAAPEQVVGQKITTATDVYALGVLLYLLLTGQHPAGEKLHSTVDLIKSIVEFEPVPPSSLASSTKTNDLAENRGCTPEKLGRLLRGDLDTIIGKALKKNPAERYASVTAFADDLQRFQRHEQISARPDTISYRTAKFVRRNRTVLALTIAAIWLVIGSLSVGLYVANRERRDAEHRFAEVRQLANKFIALDNELRGLPGSTRLRMQIVSDSLQYLNSLSGSAPVDKDLALEMAYAYVRVAHAQGDPTSPNLGQFAEAASSLNSADAFVDTVLAKDPRNQRALFIAATIAHDRMTLANARSDRTAELEYATQAASLVDRFMNTRPVTFNDLYSMRYFYTNVAWSFYDLRNFDKTILYSQRALDIALPGTHANDLRGGILLNSAAAQWQSGNLDGALNTAREAVGFATAEAADGHAALRINLATAFDQEGMILGRKDAEPSLLRTSEALVDFQKAFDIAEDLAGKDAADYLSRHNEAMFGLEIGNILRHSDSKKALAVYDHSLARIREAEPNVSTQGDEAELLVASSYVVRWQGHEDESKLRVARAFELLEATRRFPADKVEPMSDIYDALRAKADDYGETGQVPEAIEAYSQLLTKMTAWGADPRNDLRDATCISRTWTALASLLRKSGQLEEANHWELVRMELWNEWNVKLPNAQPILRQSLSQVASHDVPASNARN